MSVESMVEKADVVGLAKAIVDVYMSELARMDFKLHKLAVEAGGKLR